MKDISCSSMLTVTMHLHLSLLTLGTKFTADGIHKTLVYYLVIYICIQYIYYYCKKTLFYCCEVGSIK